LGGGSRSAAAEKVKIWHGLKPNGAFGKSGKGETWRELPGGEEGKFVGYIIAN